VKRRGRVGEFVVAEGREGLARAVDERFDEFEALGDFFGSEAGFVVHWVLQLMRYPKRQLMFPYICG